MLLFYTQQKYPSNLKAKDIFPKQKLRNSSADQGYKKIKGSPSGRRKIPEGNLDLHKGMKNTRNDKYVSKYERTFSHFKFFSKRQIHI